MKLTNNTVLVTGGGSGIGQGLAEMLHARGNHIIIAGRNKARLDAVTAANEGMQSIELDITDSASIDSLVTQVKAEYPKLNAVILNAGIMRPEEVGNNDVQTAKETIATNLTGVIELNSKLLPIIKANTNPVIMTVSSGLAFVPTSMFPTYCATKAAIHSYTQSLRSQLKTQGVQVIELAPPYVQTELTGPQQATDPSAMPLTAFIEEVTSILEGNDAVEEVLVENVKYLREAESSGEYATRYAALNQ